LVGDSVFLTCHRGAGGEYPTASRLGLLIGNRWISLLQDQIVLAVMECANCSRHATVGVAISETVVMVSLSTCLDCPCCPVPFVSGEVDARGGRPVLLTGLTK